MAERKRYFEVNAPILNKNIRVLGTEKSLVNKTIKLDMSRKMRGKGVLMKLRILNSKEGLIAVPNRLEISNGYIKKVMKKRTSYVEDSFKAKTSDIEAIIKPILITRKKVSRAVRKNLRNTAREFLLNYAKSKRFIDFFAEVLSGTLQKEMLPKLKKIYPLSFCDIRVLDTKEIQKAVKEND